MIKLEEHIWSMHRIVDAAVNRIPDIKKITFKRIPISLSNALNGSFNTAYKQYARAGYVYNVYNDWTT